MNLFTNRKIIHC